VNITPQHGAAGVVLCNVVLTVITGLKVILIAIINISKAIIDNYFYSTSLTSRTTNI
jgi:hypothetical protein